MLTCEHYLRPGSLDEAFDELDNNPGRCRILAGATDVLPWAREGRAGDVHCPILLDVSGIPELRSRDIGSDRVRIGAATPFQRFLDDADLKRALPGMADCAVWFADDQIRESATLGGNIVNASPAADGIPPMLIFGAVCVLARRRQGTIVNRTVGLDKFILGPGRTSIEQDEILVRVECDALRGYGGAFEKVGHRRSLVISLICVAAAISLDRTTRRFRDVRLAVGGIAPVPQRLTDVEALLRGAEIGPDIVDRAAELAAPLVRSRSRQDYRREVVRAFVIRSLMNAVLAAGGDRAALEPALEEINA
jgi:xanthine dehydrogenase FAD-binding subunit